MLICIGGAYKMRFRVSSQQCGGVQRGLNPKWLLLSQHSRHQYCVAGSANYSGVGLWSLFRTKLNLRLWEIRGIFTESSRRVSRKPGGSRALRRHRLPPRHWHFIMRGVVAALWLETLYVKSWEELTIRLLEMLVQEVENPRHKRKQFRIFWNKSDNWNENGYKI